MAVPVRKIDEISPRYLRVLSAVVRGEKQTLPPIPPKTPSEIPFKVALATKQLTSMGSGVYAEPIEDGFNRIWVRKTVQDGDGNSMDYLVVYTTDDEELGNTLAREYLAKVRKTAEMVTTVDSGETTVQVETEGEARVTVDTVTPPEPLGVTDEMLVASLLGRSMTAADISDTMKPMTWNVEPTEEEDVRTRPPMTYAPGEGPQEQPKVLYDTRTDIGQSYQVHVKPEETAVEVKFVKSPSEQALEQAVAQPQVPVVRVPAQTQEQKKPQLPPKPGEGQAPGETPVEY